MGIHFLAICLQYVALSFLALGEIFNVTDDLGRLELLLERSKLFIDCLQLTLEAVNRLVNTLR